MPRVPRPSPRNKSSAWYTIHTHIYTWREILFFPCGSFSNEPALVSLCVSELHFKLRLNLQAANIWIAPRFAGRGRRFDALRIFNHFALRVRRVKSVLLLLSWIPFVPVGRTKSFLAAKKRSPPNEIISFHNGCYMRCTDLAQKRTADYNSSGICNCK